MKVDQLAAKLSRLNVEAAEVFNSDESFMKVYVENDRIQPIMEVSEAGVGVRTYKDGKTGFSATNNLTEEGLERCVETALSVMRSSRVDEELRRCPIPLGGKGEEVETSDKGFEDLESRDLVALCRRVVEAVKEAVPESIVQFGSLKAVKTKNLYMNTFGSYNEGGFTALKYNFKPQVSSEGKQSEGIEQNAVCKLSEFNPEDVGRRAALKAKEMLRARVLKTLEADWVIAPDECEPYFYSGVVYHALSSNMHRKRSKFIDKLGLKVASEKITVVEDPRKPYRLGSCAVDGEGTPTTVKTVLDKGVLKTVLYNGKEAAVDNVDSTGNHVRSHYGSPGGNGVHRITVLGGDMSLPELLQDMGDGYMLIKSAAAGADPYTGAVNVDVREAYRVERGEVKYPVRKGVLTANLNEILQTLEMTKETGNVYGSDIPWILAKAVHVAAEG